MFLLTVKLLLFNSGEKMLILLYHLLSEWLEVFGGVIFKSILGYYPVFKGTNELEVLMMSSDL